MTRIPILLVAVSWIGLLHAQSQQKDLFLAPDIKSFKAAVASLGDPRISGVMPVENDAKAVLGWHTATFSGKVVGFVSDAKIGKDLLPVDGAPIHVAPGVDSPLLGTYADGGQVEVIDTGTWWKLNIQTSFPVYFIVDSPSPVALEDTAGSEEIDIYPVVIEDDTTIFDTSVETAAETASPVTILPRTPEPRIGIVSRNYSGQLLRAKKGIGPFKPKATYKLVNDKGKRLVWVDFDEIIMPGTIRMYIGRNVLLRGEPVQDEKSGEWVVYARTIQENP